MRWQVLPLRLEQECPGLENRVGEGAEIGKGENISNIFCKCQPVCKYCLLLLFAFWSNGRDVMQEKKRKDQIIIKIHQLNAL